MLKYHKILTHKKVGSDYNMANHYGVRFNTKGLIFWIDCETFNGESTVKDLVNGNVGTCTSVTKHSEGWFSFGSNANRIDSQVILH